jgi:prophage regulatory protein
MKNDEQNLTYSDDQLLRINDVAEITTLSKSCINLWVAQGKFPKPMTLSKTVKLWTIKQVRAWTEKSLEEGR